jgi:hypothetical protein
MFARKIVACVVLILSVLAVASMSASSMTWNRTTHFTFNMPVRLPGVLLTPGTYTFELASSNDLSLVRVRDRSGTKVYLTAFTYLVTRPDDKRLDPAITLGEATPSAPRSIKVWYPQGELTGRQFIY